MALRLWIGGQRIRAGTFCAKLSPLTFLLLRHGAIFPLCTTTSEPPFFTSSERHRSVSRVVHSRPTAGVDSAGRSQVELGLLELSVETFFHSVCPFLLCWVNPLFLLLDPVFRLGKLICKLGIFCGLHSCPPTDPP